MKIKCSQQQQQTREYTFEVFVNTHFWEMFVQKNV
jgi:hypothetical protein